MSKKFSSIATSIVLALSLTACSNSAPEETALLASDIPLMDFAELSATTEYKDWLGKNCAETTISRDLDNLGVFTLPDGAVGDRNTVLASRAKRLNSASASYSSANTLVKEVLSWDQYYDQTFDPGTGTEESSKINYAWLDPQSAAESVITTAFAESFYVLSSGSEPKASATQPLIDDWIKACGIQTNIDSFFEDNADYIDAITRWKAVHKKHFEDEGYVEFEDSERGNSFLTKITNRGSTLTVDVVHFNKGCSVDGLGVSAPGKPDVDGMTGSDYNDSTYIGNEGSYTPFSTTFEVADSGSFDLTQARIESIYCN